MYPRSFLCEEAKIKQRSPLKKELCEIGEEAIWESRFTSFLLFRPPYSNRYFEFHNFELGFVIRDLKNFKVPNIPMK